VTPDTTNFEFSVDAPSGVDLEGLTNFEYFWNAEGGQIAVNSDNTLNTQGQAAALVQVSAFEAEIAKQIGAAVAGAVSSALSGGLLGGGSGGGGSGDPGIGLLSNPVVQQLLEAIRNGEVGDGQLRALLGL